jgi:hypothetical protein
MKMMMIRTMILLCEDNEFDYGCNNSNIVREYFVRFREKVMNSWCKSDPSEVLGQRFIAETCEGGGRFIFVSCSLLFSVHHCHRLDHTGFKSVAIMFQQCFVTVYYGIVSSQTAGFIFSDS